MFGSVALITKKAIGSERANENYVELEGTEMCLKTGRKDEQYERNYRWMEGRHL